MGSLKKSNGLDWFIQNESRAAIRAGLVSGVNGFRKQGANNDIDTDSLPETIWFNGGLYPWQDGTDQAAELVSADAADTSAGTGARTVRIVGLAGDDWEQVSETVTLNGTTAVATVRTDWKRIDRAVVVTAGSGQTNAGKITVQVAGGGDVFCALEAETSGTQLCVLTIPGDRKGAILGISLTLLSTANATECEVGLFTRDNSVADAPFRLRSSIGLRGAGTTTFQEVFDLPIIVNPKTDIELRVLRVDSNNVSIAAVFEVIGLRTWFLDQD